MRRRKRGRVSRVAEHENGVRKASSIMYTVDPRLSGYNGTRPWPDK